MKKIALILILAAVPLSLSACSQDNAEPTLLPSPEATSTALSEAEEVVSDTDALTGTAEAAVTEEEATDEPTATLPPPVVKAPSTPTPKPEPTELPATPTAEAAPSDYGVTVNALTGETPTDPSVLQRRPISLKLSNAPAQYTRPQSGLNDADIVFEHTTEGNLTRFTAIFYDTAPPKAGPVRSARLIDHELPAMYDAALAYSGSSNGVTERLYSSDFADRILSPAVYGFYRTGENKPLEHTLYVVPENLWQVLDERGLNTPPDFQTFNIFSEDPPEDGLPADQAIIDYGWTYVLWDYDPATGYYKRWTDGEPHLDGNTMEQVRAANVIYVQPYHILDPNICEQAAEGVCQHLSVQIQLWGTGGAVVFRDGQRYDVQYQRIGRNDMLTFTDYEGNPFPLDIGNSWVQVVPTWTDDALSNSE